MRLAARLARLAIVGCFAPTLATAALVDVDPDAFAAGTNISSAFTGVTLSAVGTGFGNPTANIYAVNPTALTEPFTPSTGTLSFGTDAPTFPHLFREPGFIELRIDIAAGTDFVSIDFIGNDSSDTGELRVFDSGNNLLATLFTASLSNNQVGTLSFLSGTANIAYVLASGDSGSSSIGIDHFVYNSAVPEPGTLALIGLALIAVRLARRAEA